jgi:murein DD-endopeptidase MepM/ murein hydrolase activator NlpD
MKRTILSIAAACVAGLVILSGGACARSSPQPEADKRDILLPLDSQSIDGKVPQNATLENLLKRQNLSSETTGAMLKAMTDVFNPRDLRANQTYRVTRSLDGFLREFRYQIDEDRLLRVFAAPVSAAASSAALSFTAEVITVPKEYRVEAMVVQIGKGQSLVGVLEAHDENVQLALELAAIYGGEVDFNSDLQPGDRFEILFERALRNGEFAGYGRVLAAAMTNEGRRRSAVLFEDADGHPAYYDNDGRSLKRQFLKSPLPFDPHITSRFSNSRFHPVYGGYRPHQGVDYGAPYGTAVNVVASGVVDFVGMQGDAGRMVRVRHSGGYQTAYLHLSAFAPGLHVGQHIGQGDFIGRVGTSGATTGPHLDYRIIKNGVYVDPTAELKRMPKGESIIAGRLPAFAKIRDEQTGRMATLLAAPAATGAAHPAGK